jgi:hypothetical protein
MNLERIEPKLLDDPFSKLISNAADHARAEIPRHPFSGGWWRGLQHVCPELQTVRSVCQPNANSVDVLACGNRCGMADERH